MALRKASKTYKLIAGVMGRSESAVGSVCRAWGQQIVRKKACRKPKLSPQARRLIVRKAAKGQYYAHELRNLHAPHMSVRRIQQVLNDAKRLEWIPRKAAPKLTPLHKLRRVEWASSICSLTSFCGRRSFSPMKGAFRLMDRMAAATIGLTRGWSNSCE